MVSINKLGISMQKLIRMDVLCYVETSKWNKLDLQLSNLYELRGLRQLAGKKFQSLKNLLNKNVQNVGKYYRLLDLSG